MVTLPTPLVDAVAVVRNDVSVRSLFSSSTVDALLAPGSIPPELGGLKSLKSLNLHNNKLTGTCV